jgi:predicted TIM-barrel fold metal-dependent hydrolase
MKIDNHVHIGVDPLFYLQGWSPYCLDLKQLQLEAEGTGINEWVVFPFVSYTALDCKALRQGRIEISGGQDGIPYRFENRRLLEELNRLNSGVRACFRQFLMADPGRQPTEQVKEWESLTREYRFHGVKIQATIIQSPITSLLGEAQCMLDFAEERNLPFLIHSSIDPSDIWSQCADILRVVEARPGIRFVLAHSCRFHRESLDRVASLPNAWFDCSAHVIHCYCAARNLPVIANPADRFPSDYSSPETVLRDLAAAYPDKLIWGSDSPFYSYEDKNLQLHSSYRREVAVLDALSPTQQELVSHRNTLAWLEGRA